MVRTQVYSEPEQHRALKRLAKAQGASLTEVLRRLVDRHVLGKRLPGDYDKEAVMAFIGLGASGHSDTSERHDEVLADSLRAEDLH